MQEILELIAKTYGLVGVFLVLPLVSSVVLWRDNKSLRDENKRLHEDSARHIQECNNAVVDSQKQRVADAQAISAKLIEMVSEQASLNKETILSLDRISDSLTGLKLEARTKE
jgi:hypothetical protein